MTRFLASRLALCLLAAVAGVLPSCTSDGQICLLGYTSQPNYDLGIHTVHVPIFKNNTFIRGLEFELTQALIRDIEAKTPYKVVSCAAGADTELTGTILNYTKALININPLNEVREAQTVMTVQVTWKDLRPGHTGDILSGRKPVPPPPPALAGGPPPPPPPSPPTVVQSIAGFIPELGQSLATAEQSNVNQVATQIISLMEKPW